MSRQFKQLIEELCALINMGDAQHLMHSGPFAVNGVIFTIMRDWLANTETLLLQADCGAPRQDCTAAAYSALLQRNYSAFQHHGPLFGVSPATGGIIYMERMKVADTSAAALAGTLAFVADHAGYWRCTQPMPPHAMPRISMPCLQLA
jgi:hypothetical protein